MKIELTKAQAKALWYAAGIAMEDVEDVFDNDKRKIECAKRAFNKLGKKLHRNLIR
jgi:hypothetical protein